MVTNAGGNRVRRWIVEFFGVFVIASVAGTVAPRVFLVPRLPRAIRRTHAPPPPPPPPRPEIVIDDPAPTNTPPPPPRRPSEVVTPRDDRSHHHALPAGLTRVHGRWMVDVGRLGDPRHAVAGVRLQAPEAREGYTITALDRHGLLDAMGVRVGDVLVEVNGTPTLDPDQAIEAYARVRNASSFAFRFRRGGGTYEVHIDTSGTPR